jgi:hypothetical protein
MDRLTQNLPPHSRLWGVWEIPRDGDSSRALQVSPLFWGIFSQLWTARAFSISRRTHNLSCFWNLGPHGFENSGLHIDRIFSENRSVICLQDLSISLSRKEEIRNDLERRFPYKVFISVYQHRSTQRHQTSGYVFSTLTALHTGVFTSVFSFQLGAPVHRYRRGKRQVVFTDAGRSLGITATLRSGERIHLLNVYLLVGFRPHVCGN